VKQRPVAQRLKRHVTPPPRHLLAHMAGDVGENFSHGI